MSEKLFNIDSENLKIFNTAPNLGPKIPVVGYNFQATGFVSSQTAAAQKADYLETTDIINHNDWDYLVDKILENSEHDKLITGEISVVPAAENFAFLDYFVTVFNKTLIMDELPTAKVVIPLTISQPQGSGKEEHGTALCLDMKADKTLDIILLEQHAFRPGQKDYKPHLDFSAECEAVLRHLELKMTKSGFKKINLHHNDKPVCREKGVCGIVSQELCAALLASDKPETLAHNPPLISREEVESAHHRNYLAFSKTAVLPLTRHIKGR